MNYLKSPLRDLGVLDFSERTHHQYFQGEKKIVNCLGLSHCKTNTIFSDFLNKVTIFKATIKIN